MAIRPHRWGLLAFLGIGLLAAGRAPATAADLFRVTGVPADASGANAVAARETAIDAGEREGLKRLLMRLTAPADHRRLPALNGLSIDRFVESYEVASEKVGPTRYIAALNVRYLPGPVADLLRGTGLPFVDRRSEPTLLVPATWQGDRLLLWAADDPWRAAWNGAGDLATFLDLRLPLGDLGDVAGLTPDALKAGDAAAMGALAERYGAKAVLVAFAATPSAPSPAVTSPAAPDAATGEPAPPAPVTLELRRADNWNGPFGQTTVRPEPGETEAAFYGRAVNAALLAAEDEWKRQNLVSESDLGRLQATVPLADLPGWVQIRSALTGVPGVRTVRVETFARDRAVVAIGYAGTVEQLEAAAADAGLDLVQENDGWLLRRAGARAVP